MMIFCKISISFSNIVINNNYQKIKVAEHNPSCATRDAPEERMSKYSYSKHKIRETCNQNTPENFVK